jgi:RimJ/RimL family protein N-acetyltransferase
MPSFASALLHWIAPRPGFPSVLEFETPRLRVRPLAADDVALYCDLYTDAQTMRFIGPPLSVERATRLLHRYLRLPPAADQPLLFAILEKQTGNGLGICSIHQLDERKRRAEVGIMLKAALHGRGFGKEGLAALVRQAFAILPVDEIGVRVAADHSVVERLVVSVGFARRTGSGTGGEPHATHFWSVCRDSWPPRGPSATERMPCRT